MRMPIKDLAPYMLLMQYAAKESINADELAQKLGKARGAIMSYVAHAVNDADVYNELRATHGYANSQILAWFAREGSTATRHAAKAQAKAKASQANAKLASADAVLKPATSSYDKLKEADDLQKRQNPAAIGEGEQKPDTAQHSTAQLGSAGDGSAQLGPAGDGSGGTIVRVELPKIPSGVGKMTMPTSFKTPLGQDVETPERVEIPLRERARAHKHRSSELTIFGQIQRRRARSTQGDVHMKQRGSNYVDRQIPHMRSAAYLH